uniref:MAP3K12 binding inhibitory protein 1 n=1 Tax=Mus musculus TaxID=10090 RepID=A0A1W2P7F0_MOUSE
MAAAAELSSSSGSERSLEQCSSPLLTREVLCEVFRSLHTLTRQIYSLIV